VANAQNPPRIDGGGADRTGTTAEIFISSIYKGLLAACEIGRATIAAAPGDTHNAVIAGIDRTHRNAQGEVGPPPTPGRARRRRS
jgi:hypothetical protein